MRISLTSLCLMLVTTGTASAASTVTFYRDGSLLHQEAVAVKGVIDLPLATAILDHTLTVIPAPGTTITGVEARTAGKGDGQDRELEALTEQRRRLEDRLQALETRETIFTSAAKSQSAKAPRKSKTNPDPLQTIRQGTDFAIAQLEAVYTARRKTTQEIRKIDALIAAARKSSRPADKSVRITVSPPRGKVTLRYATAERGWQPQYTMHLTDNGRASLQLSARVTETMRGFQTRVSLASLAESARAETLPAQSGSAVLAGYQLPIVQERYPEGIFNTFSGTITNTSAHYLPAGDSVLFRGGAYLGRFRFEGLSSGRSGKITLGN